jgi:outer membrane receptor protein involved in Fe transport
MQLVLPVSLALCLCATSGKAQKKTQADTLNIDKLLGLSFEDLMNVSVFTATQSLQKTSEAPATVLVITMEQIRRRGYRSLAEVLNDLPDFSVYDKSDPQFYNRISLRGVSRQDYFVILLDGVRISSPTNEPLPILENFPIYLAKQIEVVYGPGSALYGADAMGGVINIITQKAGDSNQVAATVMGGTQGYGSASAILNKKLRNDMRLSVAGLYSYDAQPDFSKIYKDQFDITSYKTGVFNTDYGPMTPRQPISPQFSAPVKAYNAYASLDKSGFSMRLLHHYVSVPSSTTYLPDDAVYNKDVFYGQGVTTASASYTETIGKLKSTSTLVGSFYAVNPKSNYRNTYDGLDHG